MKLSLAYGAIVLLAAFQCWWGLAPAVTRLDSDFPNYYVASRLVIEGRDVSRIYDDQWFQNEIRGHGIDEAGRFTPFPPATAFVMIPLAFLTPLNALRAWTMINLCLAAAVIYLLTKLTGRELRWSALILLASGVGLANNFRLGQLYLLVAAAMLLGLVLYRSGRLAEAGLLWGLAASVKYLPAVLFVHCAMRREWRVVLVGLTTIATVHALSGLVLGFGVVNRYLTGVVAGHLGGDMPDPSSTAYQSWPSFLHRVFIDGGMSAGYTVGLAAVVAVSFGLLAMAYGRAARLRSPGMPEVSLLLFCTMSLLPASATYHFILLAVPVALLVASNPDSGWTRAAIALYAAIGFIPYSFFSRMGTAFTALAYPRLWLVTALFGCAAASVWTSARRETETAPEAV